MQTVETNSSATPGVPTGQAVGNGNDEGYIAFQENLNLRLKEAVESGEPLFETEVQGLFDVYLSKFENHQYHNCNCCRRFLERFGGLVTVDAKGETRPAFFREEDAEEEDRPAIAAIIEKLQGVSVSGVFRSADRVWGQPLTAAWRHLALVPPLGIVHRSTAQSADQWMAEKKQDFINVRFALRTFTPQLLDQAIGLLQTDSLYRSEKVLGPTQWLRELHTKIDSVKSRQAKDNLLWREVALAPSGFCHPRSSMAGSLLDDMAAGLEFSEVSRRFAAKMDPLQYQRPQAAPSAGTIQAAEKLVEKLGIEGSLARRFARLDEVKTIWKPVEKSPKAAGGTGVFGHLTAKGTPAPTLYTAPPTVMTWEKFARTVLPGAEQIEVRVGRGSQPFSSFVTATDPDAPPIIQWDSEADRNPVSWYFWNGGSTPEQWSLKSNSYCPLSGVSLQPSMWSGEDKYPHQGKGVMFLINGAKDTKNRGTSLFPEILRSELHGVRSVIEAHSQGDKFTGDDQASAAGLMFKGDGRQTWGVELRVKSGAVTSSYILDRWD